MKEKIRTYAYSLGFDIVGFARREDLGFRQDSFFKIQAKKTFGDMEYLHSFDKRHARVLSELPECRSVIVVGINSFQTPTQPGADESNVPSGRIARYAWGKDYHRVLKHKLERLASHMETLFPGSQSKICVDTEAILEKPLAVKAGLGFQGKNTLLINRTFGTWLLLGELLTTIQIEPDKSREVRDEGCGTCRACIDACPTGALPGDYTMRADLCLSYHTIESKGPIPEAIQIKMGDRLFGCDICAEVCPHNRKVAPSSHPELKGSGRTGERLSFAFVEAIPSGRAYQKLFEGTPLKRLGLKRLKRNVRALETGRKHFSQMGEGT